MRYQTLLASLCLSTLVTTAIVPLQAFATSTEINVCSGDTFKQIDEMRSTTFNGLTVDLETAEGDTFTIEGTKAYWHSTAGEVTILDLSNCPGNDFYYYQPAAKIGDVDALASEIHFERIRPCEFFEKLGLKIC